jgi:ferredoxin
VSVSIGESCVSCGACEWECPSQAISPGALRPVINQDQCTECYGFFGEAQCVVVCPVDAIHVAQYDTPHELMLRFERIHPDRMPQDTWIWRRIERAQDRANQRTGDFLSAIEIQQQLR